MPRFLAGAGAAVLVAGVLVLAGGPLVANDLWWHLEMGEVYASQGPWPDADPLLHTAHPDAPVQHEWLFDVGVHLVERLGGYPALRLVHALAAAGILALALSLLRRASGDWTAALLGLAAFASLALWRLAQTRPDLVSIAATLVIYRILLEPGTAPSWRRVAAFLLVMLVWVNAHSLFAVGLLLLAAGVVGSAARAWLVARLGGAGVEASQGWRRTRRLAAALALGLLVTLANPRGPEQHLQFLTASEEAAIWSIRDEWQRFDPLRPAAPPFDGALSPQAWLVADATLLAFLVLALRGGWRLLRRPGRESLAGADPVLFALAVAAVVAAGVSIRFVWLGIFPLLFTLGALRASGVLARGAGVAPWVLAAAALALAATLPGYSAFPRIARDYPPGLRGYLETPYLGAKYYLESVRFLRDARLEGNLFNRYGAGGFLGYWLAPRLRTFIDGRTEHYPLDVWRDHRAIRDRRGGRAGETLQDTLDRRRVDLFIGTGFPNARGVGPGRFTAEHLRGAPGWILVSRSLHHSVYLRRNARNHDNLQRVRDYYAAEGIAFDPERGLDPGAIVRSHPDWALDHELLPPGLAGAPEAELGLVYTLLGDVERAVAADRERLRRVPDDKGAHRRLVYGLLRRGRIPEALETARALRELDPADRHSAAVASVARRYARERERASAERLLDGFPLLDAQEIDRINRGRRETLPPPPDRPA